MPLKLTYNANDTKKEIIIDNIESVSESYTKNTSAIPIVSLDVDSTFGIETGCTLTYTFSFTHLYNKEKTNLEWYEELTDAVNRWQTKTDGFEIEYIPDETDGPNPSVPAFTSNGYVKSIERNYKEGNPLVIHGSISITIGTMYVNSNIKDPGDSKISVRKDEFQILMSDSNCTVWYSLLTGDDDQNSCVTSYTLSGGQNNPFEYLVMKIPKKRLTTVAYDLINDMEPGSNKIVVNAVGQCNMTLTSVKLSGTSGGGTYTIKAYCNAEVLKGTKLGSYMSDTPFNIISEILTSGQYGVNFKPGESFVYAFNNAKGDKDVLNFKGESNAWYALQVCATYLGARIFFANNKAYLVDYRSTTWDTVCDGAVIDYNYDEFFLYKEPDDETKFSLWPRVSGDVELGDEGVNTIANIQTVVCSSDYETYSNDVVVTQPQSITDSIKLYGERQGERLYIPELVEYNNEYDYKERKEEMSGFSQGSTFAKNFVEYRQEPQQSISFTLKEMHRGDDSSVWRACFPPSVRINGIRDHVNDVVINNISMIDGTRVPQLLSLSMFERHYPECTTTYTFGVMANIDLSESTSQILSNLGSVR